MNKKGFMFIETIIMCAILMVGLLVIYNSYASSIAREKERLNYDGNIADKYKIYYFKNYLKNNGHNFGLCSEVDSCPIDKKFTPGNVAYIDFTKSQIINEFGIDSTIFDVLDIEKIYLVKCDVDLSQEDSFYEYQKTLKNDCSKYRFIAEFYNEKSKKYSYANMIYPLESE